MRIIDYNFKKVPIGRFPIEISTKKKKKKKEWLNSNEKIWISIEKFV